LISFDVSNLCGGKLRSDLEKDTETETLADFWFGRIRGWQSFQYLPHHTLTASVLNGLDLVSDCSSPSLKYAELVVTRALLAKRPWVPHYDLNGSIVK